MCRIIDQIAYDTGIKPTEANQVFTGITTVVMNKVPLLKQVLEDIFDECEEQKLKDHINQLAASIQEQQWKEKFKHYEMPAQLHRVGLDARGHLF